MDTLGFGQWLNTQRREKKIDLRSLAQKAKLNPSTISRIERGMIDTALTTIVRITHSLDAKAEDYYKFLTGKSVAPFKSVGPKDPGVVTLEDVIGFEKLATESPGTVEEIVAEVLNKIQSSLQGISNSTSIRPYSFQAESMFRLINGSFLYSLVPHYPYAVEVSISANSIMDIYLNDGLLTRHDVAAYALLRKSDLGSKPFMGSEQTELMTLQETSFFDKSEREIRLSELERADHLLSKDHEILFMGWNALKNERMAMLQLSIGEPRQWIPGYWWNFQNLKFGYLLIIMDRWMKALGISDTIWLNKIRDEMN